MSIYVIAHAWKLQIGDPTAKHVLVAYADHADQEGNNIFPAVSAIVEKTEYSERTVQRATHKLEEMGLLIPDGKSQYGTNKWRYNWNWEPPTDGGVSQCHPHIEDEIEAPEPDGVSPATSEGDTVTVGGVTLSKKVSSVTPEPSSVIEPSINRVELRSALLDFFVSLTGLDPPKDDYKTLQKLWWGPLLEIASKCDNDYDRTCKLIRWATGHLDETGFTVYTPNSLVKTAVSEQAKRKRLARPKQAEPQWIPKTPEEVAAEDAAKEAERERAKATYGQGPSPNLAGSSKQGHSGYPYGPRRDVPSFRSFGYESPLDALLAPADLDGHSRAEDGEQPPDL